MMNFVQSTMNLDDYSERNYGVAHRTDTREKNNARTSIQVCSCTRSQVAARLVLNLNFTVLSLSWKMMMLLTLSNLKSDN